MGKQREPEIPDIERGAGYAEALIEQSIVDRVPTSVLLYAAAIILHGKSSSIEDAIATIREVATYR